MYYIFYFSLGVLLSPLLLIQGLYTRKKASGLPEAEGDRAGVVGTGKAVSVLILGDSAGAGVGVDKQEDALSGQLVSHLSKQHRVHWQLHAKTGDTTLDCLKYLMEMDKPQALRFDHVLISLGVNDVTSRVPVDVWLEQVEDLIRLISRDFQPQSILWSELPPMGKFIAMPQPLRWFVGKRRDRLADVLANWFEDQANVELLSFPDVLDDKTQNVVDWIASDGFHPGKKMYALWGKIAAERIMADNLSIIN